MAAYANTPSPTATDPRPVDAGWFDWAYKGVDHTLPGNGGPECRDFLSLSQRCWESAMGSGIGLVALLYAYPRLRLPVACPQRYRDGEPRGKRILLILMCLTFGIELGFKFSTRQVIWIGNPCHLATMMQIFILAAPPSRIVTAAFRLHMHMLTGAPIAILFPVINTRLLPFETGVYFLQHILMLIIPFYLMRTGDPFIPEDLLDFKWAFTSFGFLYIYHFLPLQFLAYHSQVNLNNMLCPAVSDPFHGKYYRLFAICHQIILIPTLGKIFVILAKAFRILPPNTLPDAPISQVFSNNCAKDCPQEPPSCCCCCCQPSKPGSCCSDASCCAQDSFNPLRNCRSIHSNSKNNCSAGIHQSCQDSGISSPSSVACSRTKDRTAAASCASSDVSSVSCCVCDNVSASEHATGKCRSSYGPDESGEDQGNSTTRVSRTMPNPTSEMETRGNCSCNIASQPLLPAAPTAAPCGEGMNKSSPDMPLYVTRRLVNGKLATGCQQQKPQQCSNAGCKSKSCGDNGGCGNRHRSDSGNRRRGSLNGESRGGQPLSMSELDGRNGHAKAH